ncbi:hypothetical protein C0989_006208 [Termitomyces sp. Mn162]|nr:hypothetical protein C0989_006208 [Termitomyces sp. Mn162]
MQLTEVELPMPCTSSPPSKDFCQVDWQVFNVALMEHLQNESPAVPILTELEFDSKVHDLIQIIQEVIALADFSCDRVLDLKTTLNGVLTVMSTNEDKARALAESFFPPPPSSPSIPHTAYPFPISTSPSFSTEHILATIGKLLPFKALGPDRIPNIVLKQCTGVLSDHLYFIFAAVFELDVYYAASLNPPLWYCASQANWPTTLPRLTGP